MTAHFTYMLIGHIEADSAGHARQKVEKFAREKGWPMEGVDAPRGKAMQYWVEIKPEQK